MTEDTVATHEGAHEGDVDAARVGHASLIAALAAAQGEFPPITKGKTATVKSQKGDYTYSYADIGDVLALVRPVLSKHGLALVQRTLTREDGKTTLLTELHHEGGGVITSNVDIGQSPGSPQAFGGALTYLRRYELVTLLGIAAEEDRDAQDVPDTTRRNGEAPPAELPAWAAAVDKERLGDLEPLAATLGRDRVRAFIKSVHGSLGFVPDVVVKTARLLDSYYTAALDEVGHGEAIRRERVSIEEEARRVEAERAEADPPVEGETVDEANAHAAAEAPDPPPPDPDRKPPSTVDPPDVTGCTHAEAMARYKAAGCSCDDPSAARRYELEKAKTGEGPESEAAKQAKQLIDAACPIMGHGIPF